MDIRSNFSRSERVTPDQWSWQSSPTPGVERMMLDRIGGEVARATSLVRFAAGHRFPAHDHGLGEEFIVLDGVFSDASGDYGPGSYVRNPPGTAHAPHSDPGCMIFVKLRQFDPNDLKPVALSIDGLVEEKGRQGSDNQADEWLLHAYGAERVTIERWAAGVDIGPRAFPAGAEILVLDGAFTAAGEPCPTHSWLRYAPGAVLHPQAPDGALVWIKQGHLADRVPDSGYSIGRKSGNRFSGRPDA